MAIKLPGNGNLLNMLQFQKIAETNVFTPNFLDSSESIFYVGGTIEKKQFFTREKTKEYWINGLR